ncbi:glutathione synthetase large chain [Cordyceps fumosorosea ARSEF 2679]|uniref:Glutathione synthetase n=1 Tax=Cordyceps fumosorosea (strain ARSEF 2679) TaxID=1081104 RepID=A0A166VRU1_CORFA|nr:glutathione synthetase large chain [Cordyceps fumosorosea ARSEF 2679]OAA33961.1 glutathione synthetase large chain [Cordyceps fumosorosea ARSEF 2679]
MFGLTGLAYPPSLSEAETEHLINTIKDWSASNGLMIRPPPTVIAANVDPKCIAAINAPVTLFPSPFPRQCFAQALGVQTTYNELYAAVSRNEEFIEDTVKQVIEGDEFIKNLWAVHQKVKAEGYTQSLSLGIFRSDYMIHQDTTTDSPTFQAKQVEFNTIAASFGGLSYYTSRLHRYLSTREYPLLNNAISSDMMELPSNNSVPGLAAGLETAFNAYPTSELGHTNCILFLVQDGERNIFDQRHLEYRLAEVAPSVPLFRLALSRIKAHTSLADTPRRQLLYHPPQCPGRTYEVAVVYLRGMYDPSDFPDQDAWDARYHLERSAAIKCPTVLTQLAGTKKVQQVLATTPQPAAAAAAASSVLSSFIKVADAEQVVELSRTFTNIYPMDTSPAGLEARRRALDPALAEAYVLKPQREGGGNNIYRGAIPAFLSSIPEEHWKSYILMELITPPPVSNLILRNGALEKGGVICELGIYGTCLWDQKTDEIHHNELAGYLLRTKGDKSEEGGVAAGYGCMDSCWLV